MRRFGVVLAVAACCAALGCGGDDDDNGSGSNGGLSGGSSSSEEAAVKAGLTAYAEAIKDNDPAEACEHMTSNAQDDAADTVPGSTTCERAHRTILGVVGAKRGELAEQLAEVEFEIEIDDDKAVLTAPGRAGSKPLNMRKVGDEWKLDQNTLTFNPNSGG